jgi:hypothetical protein
VVWTKARQQPDRRSRTTRKFIPSSRQPHQCGNAALEPTASVSRIPAKCCSATFAKCQDTGERCCRARHSVHMDANAKTQRTRARSRTSRRLAELQCVASGENRHRSRAPTRNVAVTLSGCNALGLSRPKRPCRALTRTAKASKFTAPRSTWRGHPVARDENRRRGALGLPTRWGCRHAGVADRTEGMSCGGKL